MKDLFAAAICGKYNGPEIYVEWKTANAAATYPAEMLDLLKTDPAVRYIMDTETGEVIFDNN